MAAGVVAGIAMVVGAIATALINDRNQRKASEEQLANQMKLSRQNQAIGLENWKQTNAAAQRREYEKAGLSVGMMYSGKGGGGTMGMTPQGNISKRDIGEVDLQSAIQAGLQGKQLELQQKQQEANINNTNADTELKNIEAEQRTGVDLATKEATLENLKAQNQKLGNDVAIGNYETKLKEIEAKVATETERDLIYQIKATSSIAIDQSREAYAKANVAQKTQDEAIKQIEQTTKEQGLRMLVMKLTGDKISMETAETKQQIREIATKIEKLQIDAENQSREVVIKQRELLLKEIATDFMYGDEARALRLLNAGEKLLGGGKSTKQAEKHQDKF